MIDICAVCGTALAPLEKPEVGRTGGVLINSVDTGITMKNAETRRFCTIEHMNEWRAVRDACQATHPESSCLEHNT